MNSFEVHIIPMSEYATMPIINTVTSIHALGLFVYTIVYRCILVLMSWRQSGRRLGEGSGGGGDEKRKITGEKTGRRGYTYHL